MTNRVMNVARKAAKSLSVKRINENTKRRNMRFQKMDLMQQRVTIAKDALTMLNMKKLLARRGTYISPIDFEAVDALPDDASCALQLEAAEACRVCALGAVFMGAVRRGAIDECEDGSVSLLDVDDGEMREILEPYFTHDELWAMEDYFESGYSTGDDARLREVLNTIIKSNGQKVRPDVDADDSDYF